MASGLFAHKRDEKRHTVSEVFFMAKKKKRPSESNMDSMRLDPEQRLCAKFDSVSVAKFPVAKRDEMGVRVVDNCPQEHIQ
jgi:hypothetical protein